MNVPWFRSLRTRFALSFAGAVLLSAVIYASAAMGVLALHDAMETVEAAVPADAVGHPHAPHDEQAEKQRLSRGLAASMVLAAPVAALLAWLAGRRLARRALAPLTEAASRASAARRGGPELELPLRGRDDEWDDLARVVNDLLADDRRAAAQARAFSANAAHELRTPLAALLGEVQLALRRDRTGDDYRATLHGVEEEVTRLTRLVERLLVLSRADSGELAASAIPFDLASVTGEAVAAARGRPGAAGRISLEVTPAPVRGDPVLARRIIENLVENALRYGGPNVQVVVGQEGATCRATVSDDGPGLAPSVRARLFERFNRPPGNGEGSGLGLSIARALAGALGGALRLDDGAPGTRFVLDLPAAPPVGEEAAAG